MLQISVELEEAAHISGAHFLTRFRKIVFPLSKNGFMSGFMLIFMAIGKKKPKFNEFALGLAMLAAIFIAQAVRVM